MKMFACNGEELEAGKQYYVKREGISTYCKATLAEPIEVAMVNFIADHTAIAEHIALDDEDFAGLGWGGDGREAFIAKFVGVKGDIFFIYSYEYLDGLFPWIKCGVEHETARKGKNKKKLETFKVFQDMLQECGVEYKEVAVTYSGKMQMTVVYEQDSIERMLAFINKRK